VQAVSLYCAFTDCLGIEFVVVSTASDTAPYRRYANGLILVPCAPAGFPATHCLYDGWMPISNVAASTIVSALQTIDETICFASYMLAGASRWVVKYAECVTAASPIAQVSEDDHELLGGALSRLRDLPTVLQEAVFRAIHWKQHASVQVRSTDALLALWQGLESLLLATYQHGVDIGLELPSHKLGLSKAQRRRLRAEAAQAILLEEAADPVRAVSRAYFDAVVGIRRRCEEVLSSLLGQDARIVALFDSTPGEWSPHTIRNAILHEGRSAVEVELSCDVPARCRLVSAVLKEVVSRLLRRAYGGVELPTRTRTFSVSMTPLNSIPCSPGASFQAVGDFSINLGLLVAKGVI